MDVIAELQHEIRKTAHDVAAECGFVMSLRQCYARGDYGEVHLHLLAGLELSEARLRVRYYQLARDDRLAAGRAEVERLRKEFVSTRLPRQL